MANFMANHQMAVALVMALACAWVVDKLRKRKRTRVTLRIDVEE